MSWPGGKNDQPAIKQISEGKKPLQRTLLYQDLEQTEWRLFCHKDKTAERTQRLLVKCCHLQPAGLLLATCPSVLSVPSERRLTDKPGCLAAMDPPPPREKELSHPSAGPDTSAPPTKHLFTPKHPEEEGPVLITPWLRGRPSCPCCQRLGTVQPSPRPAVPLVFLSATSPVFTPATETLQLQQW